ncbi:hypothetical protein LPB136_05210 [Tenacibaculum todarodis]|uniref:Uncharacterized protein n=1 Tax=Tenacibaculum todarodis TaxID=1850252 RepID=A0A1L3JI28_9FLAO|nr:hypothetical protein [Tenacibaculum todarodis]APG64796.1 hypothetical protein LPB136_05210 [Tenacibaculum todarodis]
MIFLFSGPSSFGDFILVFLLFMLLPTVVIFSLIKIIIKGNEFYQNRVSGSLLRVILYNSFIFVLSVVICFFGFWIYSEV